MFSVRLELLLAVVAAAAGSFPTEFYGNYSLPCTKELCLTPCANLSRDVEFFRMALGNFPIQPNVETVTLNVTIQPRVNLTDLQVSLIASATVQPGIPMKCVLNDSVCHDTKKKWQNRSCPIPAKRPTAYSAKFASADVKTYLDIIISGTGSLKVTDNSNNVLICVHLSMAGPGKGKEQIGTKSTGFCGSPFLKAFTTWQTN
ncbi:uncharacterized protein [Oscarella lobularis]|uniref:uncharacterized protein n=1 Tax=Oscarella lobularis TaxID=121494 RepID=UPI003314324C